MALTSLTKAVAFLAPAAVLQIVALQQFCIVVAITIAFELALTLFVFSSLLVNTLTCYDFAPLLLCLSYQTNTVCPIN